jgi:phosphate:Na+ symporter
VIYLKRDARKMEQKMREAHISRLVKGSQESINTSSIHLDLLGEYRRIVGLMSNHVYSLLKDSDPYNLLPRKI